MAEHQRSELIDEMIPFDVWIEQITRYARFVADPNAAKRPWIDGDLSRTSISGFDELYEQVFDDLDSDRLETEMLAHLASAEQRQAVAAFLEALRQMDREWSADPKLNSAAGLLGSPSWQRVRHAASRVLSA